MVYFCSLYIINKIILYLSTYFLHDSLTFENVAEARRSLFPFLCKQSIKRQRSALLLFRGRNILALKTEREKRNESPQSLLNPPSLILLWHSIKVACNFPLLIQSKHEPSFFCMLILMSFVWHKIWMNILFFLWIWLLEKQSITHFCEHTLPFPPCLWVSILRCSVRSLQSEHDRTLNTSLLLLQNPESSCLWHFRLSNIAVETLSLPSLTQYLVLLSSILPGLFGTHYSVLKVTSWIASPHTWPQGLCQVILSPLLFRCSCHHLPCLAQYIGFELSFWTTAKRRNKR